jgi:hypothetical protein
MTLPPKLAAVAAAQGGPFTTAQALSAGFDQREIYRLRRSGAWVRLRRGVYAERIVVPDDEIGRHILQLRAVLLTLQHQSAASHVTSAALHRFSLLDPDLSHVHITREDCGSSRTEAGVCHHDASLPPSHLTKVGDVVTTTAARAVLDIARASSLAAGLVAAESALQLGLTSRAELREVLEHCIDWPGARDASRVVSFASTLSESAGESLARLAFDLHGLPTPLQQVEVYDDDGFIARLDFYWDEQHTAGEFDGRLKYASADPDVLYKEKLREDRLRDAGVEVFRFGWADAQTASPSIRRKALDAFARAAQRTSRPSLRIKKPKPETDR